MHHSVAARLEAMINSSVLGQCATSVSCRDRAGTTFVLDCGEIAPGETMSEHTVMYGASLTKQLIGVLLALNVLEGTMSIDDPVRSYLTELPGGPMTSGSVTWPTTPRGYLARRPYVRG